MGSIINLTPYAVGEHAGKDAEGMPMFVAIVKASFTWQDSGAVVPIATAPLQEQDVFAGEPASSGILAASDRLPPKARIDVLLQGSLTFPSPVTEADVAMRVGAHLRKTVHVFGARFWLPGLVHDMVPSKPQPVDGLPIAWELSFGGSDSQDTRATELRNPAGSGVTKRPAELQGKRAPSFEDASTPIKSSNDRPAPQGFGAVAAHWQPRCKLAGTYDQAWQASRAPLSPKDFDPAYWNVAPEDQQMPDYQPGEEVRLFNMTERGNDLFVLPELDVPVMFSARENVLQTQAQVDTIIIEPSERRFSLSVLAQSALPLDPIRSRAIPRGRAGLVEALGAALGLLKEPTIPYCLVGGVDSFVDDGRVNALVGDGRVLTVGNKDGYVPGEAGAMLLLTNRPSPGALARWLGAAAGNEDACRGSDGPITGAGLQEAMAKALSQAKLDFDGLDCLAHDFSGEQRYFEELLLALVLAEQTDGADRGHGHGQLPEIAWTERSAHGASSEE